jgi:hypothetical protein
MTYDFIGPGGILRVIPTWIVYVGAFCIVDVIGQTVRWAFNALKNQPR